MSGPSEVAVACGALLDAGLKATVILGVAGGLSVALRRSSAAVRHALWAAAIACLPALPLLAAQRGPEIAVDAPWVLQLWALGAILAGLPLVLGMIRLLWLRYTAKPGPDGLLYHPRVRGPVTWGLLRPVVLFPAAAATWPAEKRAAALAHERAHIQRKDWAIHVVVWAICALFWFNPMLWLARRRLSIEAEHAADDAVLKQGVRPSDYASLLVAMTQTGTPKAALGVANSPVGQRVHAVLQSRERSPRRWPVWLLAGLLAFAALPAWAAWPTWSAPPDTLTCQ